MIALPTPNELTALVALVEHDAGTWRVRGLADLSRRNERIAALLRLLGDQQHSGEEARRAP